MTTPNLTVSAYVKRALEARENGHKATAPVEPTLGNRVRADRAGRCVKCGAVATHRAAGNDRYIVCKAHSDSWDVPIARRS